MRRAIQICKVAEMFMNWGSDEEEDTERSEWASRKKGWKA
jgi:hypothetical protein